MEDVPSARGVDDFNFRNRNRAGRGARYEENGRRATGDGNVLYVVRLQIADDFILVHAARRPEIGRTDCHVDEGKQLLRSGFPTASVKNHRDSFRMRGASPGLARLPLITNGAAFVVGFSVVFVLFFYVFSALDVSLLQAHRRAVDIAAGAVVVLLALEVLGVLRIGLLMREWRPGTAPSGTGVPSAFVLGVTFAAGWTPCIGPQLTAILTVASQHDFAGLPVMLVYCAGLGVPFLAAAALTERLQPLIRSVNRHLGVINLGGGAILLVFGLLLLSGNLTFLSGLGRSSPIDL